MQIYSRAHLRIVAHALPVRIVSSAICALCCAAWVSQSVVNELRRIVADSEITREDDNNWPVADVNGRQELEVIVNGEHISFVTTKIGSLLDVQESKDPEGLRVFYYLVQDIKCLVFSLIGLHFRVKPI